MHRFWKIKGVRIQLLDNGFLAFFIQDLGITSEESSEMSEAKLIVLLEQVTEMSHQEIVKHIRGLEVDYAKNQ